VPDNEGIPITEEQRDTLVDVLFCVPGNLVFLHVFKETIGARTFAIAFRLATATIIATGAEQLLLRIAGRRRGCGSVGNVCSVGSLRVDHVSVVAVCVTTATTTTTSTICVHVHRRRRRVTVAEVVVDIFHDCNSVCMHPQSARANRSLIKERAGHCLLS
jgi:hypothetical protein